MSKPMIKAIVPIHSVGGEPAVQGSISAWEEAPDDPDSVLIELEYRGETIAGRSEEGFFDALCEIRRTLETEGKLLGCYGSSKNVFPSPMIRSMGYGEKAYRLKLGKQAKTKDLVSIFEAGPDVEAASCAEQEAFYREWLQSL